MVFVLLIRSIAIYPVDSSIQRLKNRGLEFLFPTARALIGFFEVRRHLTMKLPAKISERATLQNL